MGEGGDAAMVEPDGVAREDYAACCCAVHNLCLSLHAEGIGTKWYIHSLSQPGACHARARVHTHKHTRTHTHTHTHTPPGDRTTGPVNFHPEFHKATGIPYYEHVVGTIW